MPLIIGSENHGHTDIPIVGIMAKGSLTAVTRSWAIHYDYSLQRQKY